MKGNSTGLGDNNQLQASNITLDNVKIDTNNATPQPTQSIMDELTSRINELTNPSNTLEVIDKFLSWCSANPFSSPVCLLRIVPISFSDICAASAICQVDLPSSANFMTNNFFSCLVKINTIYITVILLNKKTTILLIT